MVGCQRGNGEDKGPGVCKTPAQKYETAHRLSPGESGFNFLLMPHTTNPGTDGACVLPALRFHLQLAEAWG